MGTVETALLMELVVVPVVKKLAERRGIHGVTKESLEMKITDVIIALDNDKELKETVENDLADAVDNIISCAVDAFFDVLSAVNSGANRSDDS